METKGRLAVNITPKEGVVNRKITVSLCIPDGRYIQKVQMKLYRTEDTPERIIFLEYKGKKEENVSEFEASFTLDFSDIYWYHFEMKADNQNAYVVYQKGQACFTYEKPDQQMEQYNWMLKVKNPEIQRAPIWEGRNGIQIMVDRFYRVGEQPKPIKGRILKDWKDITPNWQPDKDGEYRNLYYYGGNLKGLTVKLPWLAEMEFNLIYLNPIFESTDYHHYDVENYFKIDPYIGTIKDYQEFCEEAHRLGIKVILDMVFNHTGVNSSYFKDPECQDWYERRDGKPVFWAGFTNLPQTNKNSVKFREMTKKVIRFYLELGTDGIRLDLGELFPREYMQCMESLEQEFPELIYFMERWKLDDHPRNPPMNYPLADAIIRWVRYGNWEYLTYIVEQINQRYAIEVRNRLLNNLGTHDTPTLISMLVDPIMNEDPIHGEQIWDIEGPWRGIRSFDTYGFREYGATHDWIPEGLYQLGVMLAKLCIGMLYTFQGIPCLYANCVTGKTGLKDPFSRKPPLGGENKELLRFIKSMNEYRTSNYDILSWAPQRITFADKEVMFVERYTPKGKIIIAIKRTKQYKGIELPGTVLYSENGSTKDKLSPYGMIIVKTTA